MVARDKKYGRRDNYRGEDGAQGAGLVQTAKAKVVAKNLVLSLRKTCEEVLKKGGAGVRG